MIEEIFKISGAILASVGGAAAIILSLSSWLGKLWANRIIESDKLAYASELEKIKNQLNSDAEKQRLVFSLYFEGQFKIYNELWITLSDVENEMDNLWVDANSKNLNRFIRALFAAKQKIRNSALLIDKIHYYEIMQVIDSFEKYRFGKEFLVNSTRGSDGIFEFDIQKIIRENKENREKINRFIDHMLNEMRSKISP